MTVPISVVIPVGPLPRHTAHLDECLQSVYNQYTPPDEIFLIDNGTGLRAPWPLDFDTEQSRLWRAPWALGLVGGFNCGVALARNELCILLGSDDYLYPEAVGECWRAWNEFRQRLGWYSMAVRYSNGFEQNTPCLAAMVSKELWRKSGGLYVDFSPYPACEIEFISRMLNANGALGATYRVSDKVLYYHRIHTPGSVGIA